ncbi:hypothetical protein DID76_01530 [Candidatus Marinamargulisbacteria bacterium SCGC AG-414-C22]|nr:hypothetical protein DID76_01530 [Candidatus Marinamargulisbacteria bacterium SCGC AG-414-C22]
MGQTTAPTYNFTSGFLTVLPGSSVMKGINSLAGTPVNGICSATNIIDHKGRKAVLTANHCVEDVSSIVGDIIDYLGLNLAQLLGFYDPQSRTEMSFTNNLGGRDDLNFFQIDPSNPSETRTISFNSEASITGDKSNTVTAEHRGGNFPLLTVFDGKYSLGQLTFSYSSLNLNPSTGPLNGQTALLNIYNGASGALVHNGTHAQGIIYGTSYQGKTSFTPLSEGDVLDAFSRQNEDQSHTVSIGTLFDVITILPILLLCKPLIGILLKSFVSKINQLLKEAPVEARRTADKHK